MNKINLIIFIFGICVVFTKVRAAETSSANMGDREPASSIETKKEIANQGFPQSEEAPTRLIKGEWRDSLSNSGFDWEAFYFWNGVSNQSGGVKKGAAGFSALDINMHFDFEKMLGWAGGSFHLQHHSHGGQKPAEYVGDAIGVNGYAPVYGDDSVMAQAYIRQTWADGAWDFLLGRYDFSSEFFVTDSSLIFLSNAFIFNTEFAAPGSAEMPVYPYNAPAVRVKWVIEKAGYVMWGSARALEDQPDNKPPKLGNDLGNFRILEAGMQSEVTKDVFNKFALGFWSYSKVFDKIDGSGSSTFDGHYFLMDYHFTESLAVFVRYGKANKDVTRVASSMASGINYSGVFSDKDSIGFGVSQANLGKPYVDASKAGGDDPADSEQVYELVYRNEFMPGVVLTPDFQIVKTPSMSKNTKDATVASVRLELSF